MSAKFHNATCTAFMSLIHKKRNVLQDLDLYDVEDENGTYLVGAYILEYERDYASEYELASPPRFATKEVYSIVQPAPAFPDNEWLDKVRQVHSSSSSSSKILCTFSDYPLKNMTERL
jgi:hypothetical protein